MTWRDQWPDARIETLKVMYAAGAFSSVIAAQLSADEGITITRNAVIGKIERLHLPKRTKSEPAPVEIQAKKDRERERHNRNQNKRRGSSASKPHQPRAEAKIVDSGDSLNLTLMDLTMKDDRPAECRFITNDDLANATYCGHAVDGETSWCPHHRLKLQPPRGWIGSKYVPKIACAA
jgi:hypothetical protein